MASLRITEQLARVSARRPWLVVAIWLALIVPGVILSGGVRDVLTSENIVTNNPESARAQALIESELDRPVLATETVLVSSDVITIDDPSFRTFVESLTGDIREQRELVNTATNYFETNDPAFVSADKHTTLLPVILNYKDGEAPDEIDPLIETLTEANGVDGFQVLTIGSASLDRELNDISERDLRKVEMIGVPIALVILILVFGAVVAAGIPLVLAVIAIVLAIAVLALVGQQWELNLFAVNVTTTMGLAVGIDYTLFIVHRYREQRRIGLGKVDAIGVAAATSGRAVLFSGGTVVVGYVGMFIVPSNVFRSMAVGAMAVVTISVLIALTLLPAILSLVGDRLNAIHLPFLGRGRDGLDSFWSQVARFVMARPLTSVVTVVTILVVATVPYFTMNVGFLGGASTFPPNSTPQQAFQILSEDFSAGLISPTEIVVDGRNADRTAVDGGIDSLIGAVDDDPRFGQTAITATSADGRTTLISTLIEADPLSAPAYDAIDRLRDEYIPNAFRDTDAVVLVDGRTARVDDIFEVFAKYTPFVVAFILALSFILLLAVFRSIVVPIKALVMNLLSVGATCGIVVLVFQHGVGNELFGFQQTDTIEVWLPLFLFAVLFGLSMDYHVFLLTRIRERFEQTHDNAESVTYGVRTTAGTITGAAAIMVAVFFAQAMADFVYLQQSGFGLALAVLLDATIVRSVLVPATMALLGERNWYLPKWLGWLPDLRVEDVSGTPWAEPMSARSPVVD